MGANIGTSITNTIVSMGQIADREEFSRALAGATVHDMFNWLSVLVILPLEVATGLLAKLTALITDSINNDANDALKFQLVKALTVPVTNRIVQLDKSIISDPTKLSSAKTILKVCCGSYLNQSAANDNESIQVFTDNSSLVCERPCQFLFFGVAGQWSDPLIGAVLLIASLAVLMCSLVGLVKVLKSLLTGQIETIVKKALEQQKHTWLVEYLCILLGAILTILVQSSSVMTSTLTPLVGTGIITLEKMYPLTLGSNIGTTITGILAALASAKTTSMQTALIHLFFNVIGILIWFPIPAMRKIPIAMAQKLGTVTGKYRWFALVYIATVFFLLPLLFFGLSLWHVIPTVILAAILFSTALVVAVLSMLQRKYPARLPKKLQNWHFLPKPLRSLRPYDMLFKKIFSCKPSFTKVHSQESYSGDADPEYQVHTTRL